MIESNNSVDYVDLGLPSGTLWAKCNIGASCPNEFGLYFSSQFLDPMRSPEDRAYMIMKKLNIELFRPEIMLMHREDVLKQFCLQLQGIPTDQQMMELLSECSWIWTANKNASETYYRVVSRRNNNEIILPAAGWYTDQAHQKFNMCQWGYKLGFITQNELASSILRQECLSQAGAGGACSGRYLTRRTTQPLALLGLTGGSKVLDFCGNNCKMKIVPDTIWMPVRPVICR